MGDGNYLLVGLNDYVHSVFLVCCWHIADPFIASFSSELLRRLFSLCISHLITAWQKFREKKGILIYKEKSQSWLNLINHILVRKINRPNGIAHFMLHADFLRSVAGRHLPFTGHRFQPISDCYSINAPSGCVDLSPGHN